MSDEKVMNRSMVVVGALLIQLSLGAIYAWSVFTKPLVVEGWSRAQTQAVFSAGLALFAIIMVLAGRALPKVGPRKLAMWGGGVLGLGYVLAGVLGSTNFWVLFICIGVIGGSGIGLAYVVPIAVGMRWFPDKKGFITGLAVAGFGFGAMLWVKLAGSWGHLIENIGLGNTFIIYGILFFLTVTIGGLWMVFPPAGWKPAGFQVHDAQFFPIFSGKHRGEWDDCVDCHTNTGNYAVFSCVDCHEHNRTEMDDKHSGEADYQYTSMACLECHPTGTHEED